VKWLVQLPIRTQWEPRPYLTPFLRYDILFSHINAYQLSRSSKVDYFQLMRLHISHLQQPWLYLSPFLRDDQFSIEKCSFFYPLHSTPKMKMFNFHCIAEILQVPNHHTGLIIRIKSFLIRPTTEPQYMCDR